MAPTTLITFLVRTPPSTRSVTLYGSWDNFSAPYPMQRDPRTGPEHWSGCHSFSNIICDGDLQPSGVPREGGLRMGGTYWYYYQLNDDLEFHNSAEPSTTSCPMLPGQLVNVLNVPFALSSSRSRNNSASSTSSEFRTMDPTDKFLNPRPVPPKPLLPRLNTSPTLPQQSWSLSSSPARAGPTRGRSASSRGPSDPGSANTPRVMRVTKKPSFQRPNRSTSRGSNRSMGIISAFRALASPRMASPEGTVDRGRTRAAEHDPAGYVSYGTSERSATPKSSVTEQTPPVLHIVGGSPSKPTRQLALRRESDEEVDHAAVVLSSFGQHRRQRSMSREPSSLRNSLSLEETPVHESLDEPGTPNQRLETLTEVASTTTTPVWPPTALKIGVPRSVDDKQPVPLDLEKRLPTLPNTPSSAYPPSTMDDSPSNRLGVDIEGLQSRFSSTTIETGSCTDSHINNEQSRFSDWTCSTTMLSPRSEYAPSNTTEFDPTSPLAVDLDFAGFKTINVLRKAECQDELGHSNDSATLQEGLPSALSFSTISSVTSSTAPSSHVDLDSAKDAELCWSRFQHYSLPTEDAGSGTTRKPTSTDDHIAPLAVDEQHRTEAFQSRVTDLDGPSLPHSTSMQQLLDELSYLGGMIQQK
ncbi:hypothetical protein A1O3_01212 [Capronia epimyces CBS 606.96]|uniref:Uncharacterized protein n=1 Tax=Capronia epimyces CBS 606.96 TaxID=1182542 RepID=W9YSK9_9EURO|nr:uncharacterized protein A1O3_01212 [Capronia epimyces CBS 606.96]EXJ92660.1 hypothetical protein A1O3_01212 [Capronia epimyces CBS 606.96]